MKRCILVLLLISTLFGFGENPLKPSNLSASVNSSEPVLFDNNIGSKAKIKRIQADLQKVYVLDSIEIFQKESPEKVMTSVDIVNWQDHQLIATPYGWKVDLAGQPARYLTIQNKNNEDCGEIAIYPLENYKLSFNLIEVNASTTNCQLIVKTNYPTYLQVLYGYNYEFIYEKRLNSVFTSLDVTNNHQVVISDLRPETTFRYQIRSTDYNGKELSSDYFTFTTKELKK